MAMNLLGVGRFSPPSVATEWMDRGLKSSPKSVDANFSFKEFTSQQVLTFPMNTLKSSGNLFELNEVKDTKQHASEERISAHQFSGPNKCRQLPCRTFVSTGSCPYGDRCVFLHDPSVISKPVYIKIKRKSKDDTVTDTFFWPTMPLNLVMGKLDARHQPDIAQPYIVPNPGSYSEQHNSINDAAVFSMWEHFVDYLAADELSVVAQPRAVPPLNPYQLMNRYTGKRRMPIFMQLSQSQSQSQSQSFRSSPTTAVLLPAGSPVIPGGGGSTTSSLTSSIGSSSMGSSTMMNMGGTGRSSPIMSSSYVPPAVRNHNMMSMLPSMLLADPAQPVYGKQQQMQQQYYSMGSNNNLMMMMNNTPALPSLLKI